MLAQFCYIVNRNFCIHYLWNAGFSHRMDGYISRQSCISRSPRKKISNLVFIFSIRARLYHTASAGFLLWLIARKKGASCLLISSGRWLASLRYKRTGQWLFTVAYAFKSKALHWPSPCLVLYLRSAYHTRTCFLVKGWFSTPLPPHCGLLLSSRALKPTWKWQQPPRKCVGELRIRLLQTEPSETRSLLHL